MWNYEGNHLVIWCLSRLSYNCRLCCRFALRTGWLLCCIGTRPRIDLTGTKSKCGPHTRAHANPRTCQCLLLWCLIRLYCILSRIVGNYTTKPKGERTNANMQDRTRTKPLLANPNNNFIRKIIIWSIKKTISIRSILPSNSWKQLTWKKSIFFNGSSPSYAYAVHKSFGQLNEGLIQTSYFGEMY